MNQSSALSPARRPHDIARLTAQPVDVLVVGGGVTGAGTALDAATRGLSVGLLEAQDWGAGTSSKSSKLVHGGLRYLQMLDFGLVHEALRERGLLLSRLAPHLVRPVPILYPLRRPVLERAYVGAGVALYDLLALSTGGGRGLPGHRHLSKAQALRTAPGLRGGALTGAVLYYDAQLDDARYVVELVRTAAAYGAVPFSRATVVGFLFDGDRVAGALARDAETGEEYEVRARVTISATGAWTEETEALAGHHRPVEVRPSKGVHILVPRRLLDCATGLILRTKRSVLFVLPWGDQWLIGTTDTDWPFAKARPLATMADIDYLLGEVNTVLARPLSRSDIVGVYAGLRPLVAGSGVVRGPGEARREGGTTKLSREHAVARPAPGLVVVSGGKYTTYRVMAADAVDAAVAEGGLHALPCRTAKVPLLGARGWEAAWAGRARLAADHALTPGQAEHVLQRYGSLAAEVLAAASAEPYLAEAIAGSGGDAGAGGYLGAEVAYAVTHEGARHLDDVLARRTRVAIQTPDAGMASAPAVARIMAPLLGWGPGQLEAEIDDYRRQVELRDEAASLARDDNFAAELSDRAPTLLPLP
jgi:glycerol-3-phosphate dehydrogenase